MREWANAFGKTVRQRNVRQETCSYRAGTMPLYAYEKEHLPGDAVDLLDHYESESDEVISQSSSEDEDVNDSTEEDDDGGVQNDAVEMEANIRKHPVASQFNFLRNTRSGRHIHINKRFM